MYVTYHNLYSVANLCRLDDFSVYFYYCTSASVQLFFFLPHEYHVHFSRFWKVRAQEKDEGRINSQRVLI